MVPQGNSVKEESTVTISLDDSPSILSESDASESPESTGSNSGSGSSATGFCNWFFRYRFFCYRFFCYRFFRHRPSTTGSSATGSSASSSATGSSATGSLCYSSSATGSSVTGSSATGSSAAGSSLNLCCLGLQKLYPAAVCTLYPWLMLLQSLDLFFTIFEFNTLQELMGLLLRPQFPKISQLNPMYLYLYSHQNLNWNHLINPDLMY